MATDDLYKVLAVDHAGDTRGNPYYTHVVCVRIDGEGPARSTCRNAASCWIRVTTDRRYAGKALSAIWSTTAIIIATAAVVTHFDSREYRRRPRRIIADLDRCSLKASPAATRLNPSVAHDRIA
ncbi:MAG TPA: hypothetical protein VNX29_12445 [Kaistia sp.]|nr:hypothetical protein [Kaistia sp.]